MTDDLPLRRRFFAEEVQAVGNLRTPALIEALAIVPRVLLVGVIAVDGRAQALRHTGAELKPCATSAARRM